MFASIHLVRESQLAASENTRRVEAVAAALMTNARLMDSAGALNPRSYQARRGPGEGAAAVFQTSFFRDAGVFYALREKVLPGILRRRAVAAIAHPSQDMAPLRIWSAGCATGEELYSLAMILGELGVDPVVLLGTDLNVSNIEHARRGLYRRQNTERAVPRSLAHRYLSVDEEWALVSVELRSLCDLWVHDVRQRPPMTGFDLILLRNVLPCLPREQRGPVLHRMAHALNPGGRLVLGAAECADDWSELFQAENAETCDVYRLRNPAVAEDKAYSLNESMGELRQA